MKDTETRLAFIKARAEGKSYSTIQKELNIAKATCVSWEKDLKEDIEALKTAHTEELYTAYNMKRDARIKALGDVLKSLDAEINKRDLEEVALEKLLELRLKYAKELKGEYIEPVELDTDNTLDGLLEQYNQLYRDAKTGKYSPADIKAQLAILDAKRDTLYRISGEYEREEENPLDLGFSLSGYESRLIRHDEGRDA